MEGVALGPFKNILVWLVCQALTDKRFLSPNKHKKRPPEGAYKIRKLVWRYVVFRYALLD